MDFYIVNLSHQRRDQAYIAVWRPECKGYAWPLAWGGKYPETEVRRHLDYYNGGDNVAVPCAILDEMALEKPLPGWIDGDAGPVVRNTKETWQKILANLIEPPKFVPLPEYPGAPRKGRRKSLLHIDTTTYGESHGLG